MLSITLSQRLNDILGVVHSRDFRAQQITADEVYKYRARTGSHPSVNVDLCSMKVRHDLFVDEMKKLERKLEADIERDISLPNKEPNFPIVGIVVNAINTLSGNLKSCFSQNLPNVELSEDGKTLLEKIEVGLHVGLRIVKKTLLLLPRLIEDNGIALNKENFMKAAEASFEFINELTKLSLGGITLVENFLVGNNIPLLDKTLDDKVNEIRSLVDKLSSCENIAPSVYEQLSGLHPSLSNIQNELMLGNPWDCAIKLFKPDKFIFNKETMSIILSDQAIDTLQKQADKHLVKVLSLINDISKILFGIKGFEFKPVTNYCPARFVKVKTTDRHSNTPKAKSLIKACFDKVLKEIDKTPDLDRHLKLHSTTYKEATMG